MTGIQGKIAAGMKGAGADATKGLGKEVDDNAGPFQKAIGNLGGIAKTGGKAIAVGLGVGIAGLTALTGKALASGAELEQQLGGAEAVFGKFAQGIKDQAEFAYFEAGLSQNEFLQGANKMGSLFQGAGFSVESSMKMSVDAMKRASDVASIMGIDTTSALEAVTGMAKGNFTMMDNLGVAMNDTALGAYALSKGINKTTAEMSTQEKVGLANQLFLEKTAKYAGNYQKENQSLAGSLNSTKKAFQDLLSGSGDIDGFMELLINTIELAVPRIVELLPKIVSGIGAVLKGLVPALSAALPVLLPALIEAVTGLLNALVGAMPDIVKVLISALPSIINAFIEIFLAIVKALPEIIQILAAAMPQIIDALVTGLTSPEALTAIIMGSVQLFLAIVQAIPIILPALIRAIPQIIQNIVATLTNPDTIRQLIGVGFELIKAIISGIYQTSSAIATATLSIFNTIRGILSWDSMKNIGGEMLKGLWQGISDLTGWILGKIKGFAGNITGGIKSFFGIRSPSTVFAAVGTDLNRGLAKGIDTSIGVVTNSIDAMSNQALAALGPANLEAAYSLTPVSTAQPVSGGAGNSVTIQNVSLGDSSAVREFFRQINQDTISAGMGITPVQGATL